MCVPSLRNPLRGPLQRLVAANLGAFLETVEGQPDFIRKTFRALLDCGVVEKGCFTLRCGRCEAEHAVAFSCKLRGLCPSCSARAATEGAELLVRRVLPHQAFRHWVVNYPLDVTQKLGFQPPLISAVEHMVDTQLREWMEARCGARTGGIHIRHRFGSRMNMLLHGHILLLDGGYRWRSGGQRDAEFVAAPPLGVKDLEGLAETIHGRMKELLGKRGISFSSAGTTPPPEPITGIAVRHRGLHLFASRPVGDRHELKRTCLYLLRSGVDAARLSERASGDFAYRLDRNSADGQRELVLSGPEWMKKFASLIPAARKPQRRYFGILAGGSPMRKCIVPAVLPPATTHKVPNIRIPWAELMKLTFGKDVLACKRCGTQMEVVAIHVPGGSVRGVVTRKREAPD